MKQNEVKNYFEDIAQEFDNIYDNEGTTVTKITNKLLVKWKIKQSIVFKKKIFLKI